MSNSSDWYVSYCHRFIFRSGFFTLLCLKPVNTTLCVILWASEQEKCPFQLGRERPGSFRADGGHQTSFWSSCSTETMLFIQVCVSDGFMLKLLFKHTHLCVSPSDAHKSLGLTERGAMYKNSESRIHTSFICSMQTRSMRS